MHVVIYLSNPTKHITLKANPIVNHGLCMIMLCQCNFINYNECTTLGEGCVDNKEGYVCVGTKGTWEISTFL